MAAAAVVVIALAGVLPLTLLGDDGGTAGISTTLSSEPALPAASASTESQTTTSTIPPGPPGQGPGQWVETPVPGLPERVWEVALSDDAMLIRYEVGGDAKLRAYIFQSGEFVDLPAQDADPHIAIEGLTAVWAERVSAKDGGDSSGRVYSYHLPSGPRHEIGGGGDVVGYPKIASPWVAWMEAVPWEYDASYWDLSIILRRIDARGAPEGDPSVVVESAVGRDSGEARWAYSLTDDHLAWEHQAAVANPGVYAFTGVFVKDISSPAGPAAIPLGENTWSPSIVGDMLCYWADGIRLIDPIGGVKIGGADAGTVLDPLGLVPTAAPTYVAYYREKTGGSGAEIVARGLSGGYEQILAEQSKSLWSSPNIAAASTRIAFATEGQARLFEWKGPGAAGSSATSTTESVPDTVTSTITTAISSSTTEGATSTTERGLQVISWWAAKNHVGELAMVTGEVVTVAHLADGRAVLNIGDIPSKGGVIIVISDESLFAEGELDDLYGDRISVKGTIDSDGTNIGIQVTQRTQISSF